MDAKQGIADLLVQQGVGLRVIVALGPYDVFLAVTALQLATRHPGLSSRMSEDYERIGRQLGQPLGPRVQALLAAGWDPARDVRIDSFTCPVCGARSWNPNDAANRYCGACHAFVG